MPDEDIEQNLLQDLTLEGLRAVYRERGSYSASNGKSRMFLRSYSTGSAYTGLASLGSSSRDKENLRRQERQLRRSPRVAVRSLELLADGIYPFIEIEREYSFIALSAFADLSPRGVRLLEGKGIGFSTIIRSIRRTLIASWWVLAVLLIPIYLWERIGKQGLMFTVAGLAVLLIFQYFWMRLFRRSV